MLSILLSILAGAITWKLFPLTVSGYKRWRTSRVDFFIARVMATIFFVALVASYTTEKKPDLVSQKGVSSSPKAASSQ